MIAVQADVSSDAVTVAMIVAAIGCATVGGVFFAFSTFVMKGLGRLPAPQGIAAMQSINVMAITPLFMTALFGTGALCLLLVAWTWTSPRGLLVALGSIVYVIGAILVTIAFNVPRNTRLAAVDPASPDGEVLWQDYLLTWTLWNHVRTVAALAAAVVLIVALCQ